MSDLHKEIEDFLREEPKNRFCCDCKHYIHHEDVNEAICIRPARKKPNVTRDSIYGTLCKEERMNDEPFLCGPEARFFEPSGATPLDSDKERPSKLSGVLSRVRAHHVWLFFAGWLAHSLFTLIW